MPQNQVKHLHLLMLLSLSPREIKNALTSQSRILREKGDMKFFSLFRSFIPTFTLLNINDPCLFSSFSNVLIKT